MENRKKIILVAHCLLTKGFTKLFSSEISEVIKILLDTEIGIIQMPCPHLCSLIKKEPHKNNRDNEKQSHCAGFLEESTKNPVSLYANIIKPLLAQVEEYKEQDFEIAGIIGIKNSPVCGINNQIANSKILDNCGSFINFLNKELEIHKMKIRMADIEIPNNKHL